MNILVIGNGFDLAHQLPTSYNDFLSFCKDIKDKHKTSTKKDVQELYTYIETNAWLEYFLNCPNYLGENWIYFETEIANVIRSLDNARTMAVMEEDVLDICRNDAKVITSIIKAAGTTVQTVLRDTEAIDRFSDFLYEELERLIRALEIYIAKYVNEIVIKRQSSDIAALEPDHVLSFNYSNTYERLYASNREIEYDYLHGKADINNTVETNNMVLGIDEYLTGEEKDSHTQFIAFKKYYQRMYKHSKRYSEMWCAEIKKEAEYEKDSRHFMREKQIELDLVSMEPERQYNWESYERLARVYDNQYNEMHPKHMVYIFGHSLDVTDKDILRNLILNDNVHTVIFYCRKKDRNGNLDNGRRDYGQKLKNLVKVIGQEELIKRTGERMIEFRLQSDMVEI